MTTLTLACAAWFVAAALFTTYAMRLPKVTIDPPETHEAALTPSNEEDVRAVVALAVQQAREAEAA